MVTHYGNSACEGSSLYQLKMAAPAEVSKKRSNFRIRQFYEKRHFNIAANLTLNTYDGIFHYTFNRAYCQNSVSGQTDRQNDKPSTVTLAVHVRRGLITHALYFEIYTTLIQLMSITGYEAYVCVCFFMYKTVCTAFIWLLWCVYTAQKNYLIHKM